MQRTPPKTRARAAAALLAGQSGTEAAQSTGVSNSTVTRIKQGLGASTLQKIENKKEADFNALLANYLGEILETLTAQTRHFRDEEWLREQPAAGVALLHGILVDKAFRLLEAAERARTINIE